jgi:PKD repeat protein
MRKVRRLCWVIVAVLGSVGDTLAAQGAVAGLTLSPAAAEVGVTVTARATGSAGPCGAVHIDWGDGNTITYATERLPVTQTHVYKAAGTYNLRAQGMANCSGEARTRIVITAPPPPPPPPPAPRSRQQITALSGEVPPGADAGVRSFTVQGRGQCSYVLDFGDGNNETRDAVLPDVVRHNYPAEGRYTAVATARPPCSGVMRFTFTVARSAQTGNVPGSISRVDVRPQVARIGVQIAVTVSGSGTCTFVVDFGDGQSRTLTERLPHRLTYRYTKAGDHEIVVSGQAPCAGGGDAVLRVRR